jgi:hypothetical protein
MMKPMTAEALDLAVVDSLDDCTAAVVVLDRRRRPSPGLLRYAIGRANSELAAAGLTIVVRRRRHGRPPHARQLPTSSFDDVGDSEQNGDPQ